MMLVFFYSSPVVHAHHTRKHICQFLFPSLFSVFFSALSSIKIHPEVFVSLPFHSQRAFLYAIFNLGDIYGISNQRFMPGLNDETAVTIWAVHKKSISKFAGFTLPLLAK
eukprot:909504_1